MEMITNKYTEIWNTHKIEELTNVFSKSATYQDALQDGNAIEVLSLSIKETAKAFPDVTLKLSSMHEGIDKEHVFIEWVMKGTNTGSFFGAAPTNKKVVVTGIDLIHVKDNKINTIRSYYDSNQLTTQLGL